MKLENIKRNQSEMKNILIQIKDTLQGINSAIDEAEDLVRDLESNKAENTRQRVK